MSKLVKDTDWIWIFVRGTSGQEEFLGQSDEANNINFIPAFLEKEEALKCYNLLAHDNGKAYQAQAILYEDLISYCIENEFIVFILDGSGKILERSAAKELG